jgi:hypothetical protein
LSFLSGRVGLLISLLAVKSSHKTIVVRYFYVKLENVGFDLQSFGLRNAVVMLYMPISASSQAAGSSDGGSCAIAHCFTL